VKRAVLIDLDHTVADAFPRDHMIGGNWDDYHHASQYDVPLTDMVDLLVALKAGGHPLIGITARPAKWRALTMEWLIKFNLAWLLDELLMRPDDGFRPSPEMKMELAVARFKDIKAEVLMIIDDREDVCAAFKAIGITALQCHAVSTMNERMGDTP